MEEKVFYHGSCVELAVGDEILAPSTTGVISEVGRRRRLDRVFFTEDLGSARIYAGRAARSLGGTGRFIYEVVPVGEVECLNDTPGTTVYHAVRARVVAVWRRVRRWISEPTMPWAFGPVASRVHRACSPVPAV